MQLGLFLWFRAFRLPIAMLSSIKKLNAFAMCVMNSYVFWKLRMHTA